MNIIETEYPDITETNIDESKVTLANNIIKNVYPLFDEVYGQKLTEATKLKAAISKRQELVDNNKKNLEFMMSKYDRKKKVSKLLTRLEKLVDSGLAYGGHLKGETIVLLKVIDKLPDDKLDFHLAEVLKTIGKRFSRE
jgi:hypothetical protein